MWECLRSIEYRMCFKIERDKRGMVFGGIESGYV